MAWGSRGWGGGFSGYKKPSSTKTYANNKTSNKTYGGYNPANYTGYSNKKQSSYKPSSGSGSSGSGTSSKSKVAGWTFSSFDKQYHPPSWYAPKAKPKATTSVKLPTKKVTPPVTTKKVATPISSKTKATVKPMVNKKGSAAAGATKLATAAKGAQTLANLAKVNNITRGIKNVQNVAKAGQIIKGVSNVQKATQALNTIKKSGGGTTTTSRPTGGGGGGGTTTPTTPTSPKPAPKPTPTAPKPAPKPTTNTPSPQNTTGGKFTGKGKAGRFGRRRGWGPRAGLSTTPEMLSRIARQRIVNYR